MNIKKNPFLASYLGLACICCLALGIVLFYTNYSNHSKWQKHYYQIKANLLIDDWDNQISFYEDLALHFSITKAYQPYYFRINKYNETLLLDDFENFQNYPLLSTDFFLYYHGDEYIFHSSGETVDFNTFFQNQLPNEKIHILDTLSSIKNKTTLTTSSGDIYLLIPFRAAQNSSHINAVLGVVIDTGILSERFQLAGAGVNGNIALYAKDQLLFCNQDTACPTDSKKVLTASTKDNLYTIYFLPDEESYLTSDFFTLQMLLIMLDIVFVILIANMYAQKSYTPIRKMSEKYRKKSTFSDEASYANALDELDVILDNLLQNNTIITEQINQKQTLLRGQLLQTLISGNYTFNIQPHLEKLQIRLPGPYYFVVGILFYQQENITEEFFSELLYNLCQLTNEEENTYVYGICDHEQQQLSIICSITDEIKKEDLAEYICAVAESFNYKPTTAVSSTYMTLSQLSASWLECIDIIHNKLHPKPSISSPEKAREYIYNPDKLEHIILALSACNEEVALEELQQYVAQLEKEPMSLLMQQYIFTDFISEITRHARKLNLTLSNQCVSLIVSAQNVKTFKEASQYLIHDFCENFKALKKQLETNEASRICEYLKTHFMEYELSIEKVAADLNTTTALIRQAVMNHTGKMYKDYIIFLRIEYAKELLSQGEMTVSEVCSKVGYGSIPHFITLFKEMTGVTPAKYKKGE